MTRVEAAITALIGSIEKLEVENATLRARVEELEEGEEPKSNVDRWPWEKMLRIAKRIEREVYPPDVFNGSSGDPGPELLVALRKAIARCESTADETESALIKNGCKPGCYLTLFETLEQRDIVGTMHASDCPNNEGEQ